MTSFEEYFGENLKTGTGQAPSALWLSAWDCNHLPMTREVTSHTLLVLVIVTERLLVLLLVLLPPWKSVQG